MNFECSMYPHCAKHPMKFADAAPVDLNGSDIGSTERRGYGHVRAVD